MVDNIWRNGDGSWSDPGHWSRGVVPGTAAGERLRLHPRRRRRHAGRGHARRPDGLRARPRLVADHEVGQRALRVGRPGHPAVPDPAGVDGRRPGRDPGRQRSDPRHRHGHPDQPDRRRRSAHRRREGRRRLRRAARGGRRRQPGPLRTQRRLPQRRLHRGGPRPGPAARRCGAGGRSRHRVRAAAPSRRRHGRRPLRDQEQPRLLRAAGRRRAAAEPVRERRTHRQATQPRQQRGDRRLLRRR